MLSTNYQLEEVETDAEASLDVQDQILEIRNNIRGLIDELRDICGALRPPTIDSLGLGAALLSFSSDWTKRTEIPLDLDIDENLGRLPETIELSIFRIVQEGLNNIHKHAGARKVQVTLKHTSPRALLITIVDDGCGLPEAFDLSALSSQGHYGLLGISERVALLGGRLRLQNRPDGGVLIQVEIPHPRVDTI